MVSEETWCAMKIDFKELFNNEYDDLVEQAERSTFLGYDLKQIVQDGTTNDILFVIQMICNQYNSALKQELDANLMPQDIKSARIWFARWINNADLRLLLP